VRKLGSTRGGYVCQLMTGVVKVPLCGNVAPVVCHSWYVAHGVPVSVHILTRKDRLQRSVSILC